MSSRRLALLGMLVLLSALVVVLWPEPDAQPAPLLAEPTVPRPTAVEVPELDGFVVRGRAATTAVSLPERPAPPVADTADFGALQVTVVDEAGRPCSDVPVWAGLPGQPDERLERTGDAGEVMFEAIAAGPVLVRSRLGVPTSGVIAPGGLTELTLVLPPGFRVEGVVRTTEGTGVPGASIWLTSAPSRPDGEVVTVTDAAGRFAIDRVGTGTWLGARHPEFAASSLEPVAAAARERAWVELVLGDGAAKLSGRVLLDGIHPIEGAEVFVGLWGEWGDGDPVAGPGPLAARTDTRGWFEIDGLPATRVRAVVRAPEAALSVHGPFELAVGDTRDVELHVAPGGVLTGRALEHDGRPVRLAGVHLEVLLDGLPNPLPLWGAAGADGAFRLGGVPPGEHHGRVEHPDGRDLEEDVLVIAGGGTTWNPRFEATGHAILGRAVDHAGEPLAGFLVSLHDPGAEAPRGGALTDQSGSFRFEVDTRDAFDLAVRQPDDPDIPVHVEAGVVPRSQPYLLRVPAAGSAGHGRVAGTILDADGGPLGGAHVRVRGGHAERAAVVDARGWFETPPVPPGDYTVLVETAAGLDLVVGAVVTRGDVDLGELVIPPPGTLLLRAEAEIPVVLVTASGHVARHVMTRAGTHSVSLPSGRYEVRVVIGRTERSVGSVDVRAYEDTSIDVGG